MKRSGDRSPPTILPQQSLTAQCVHSQVSGDPSLPGREVVLRHRHFPEKGSGESVLPATAKEVQLASKAADPVVGDDPVHSLHIHHCLIQLCNQTGQEQTTTGNHVCKKKLLEPTCPPYWTCTGPGSGNGQVTSLQTPHTTDTHCSSSTPLVGYTEHCTPTRQDRESFFPQAVTLMNTYQSECQKKTLCSKSTVFTINTVLR